MNESIPILIILENEIDADGWCLVAPFGEHAKTRQIRKNGMIETQRLIQCLDNESADALLDNENSLFRKLKRAIVGIPVYKRHGDLRRLAPETVVDNQIREIKIGVVDQLRKGARGIEAHFVFDPSGADAVENEGCKYPSVVWKVMPCGERNGATLVKPYQLLSIGMTPHPNISGVETVANSQETAAAAVVKPESALRERITGLLIGCGFTVPNEASDDQVFSIVAENITISGGRREKTEQKNTNL
jgi:hypothetical protein